MLDFLIGHWAMDGIIGFVLFSVGFLIALCGSMMVFKEITKKIIGFSLLVGLFYKQINGFIYSLYEPFYQGNPQVSTILILILSVLILGVICAIKSKRSIDRVFTFTMVTATTLIWVICHTAMIHKGLIFNVNQTINQNEIAVATFVKNDHREGFYDFCEASKMACFWSSDKQPNQMFIKTYEEKSKFSYNVMTQLKYKQETAIFDGVLAKSAYQLNEAAENTAFTMVINKETNVVASAFELQNVNKIHETTIVYFYSWFALALVFWVWGFLALLYFHHSRFNKRLSVEPAVVQIEEQPAQATTAE